MKNIKNFIEFTNESLDEEDSDEHVGDWFHGGHGKNDNETFLYVTDELKEAKYYAALKNGKIYKLKNEYNNIVSWAMGQSEGMIKKKNIKKNGGFNNIFEIFKNMNENIRGT